MPKTKRSNKIADGNPLTRGASILMLYLSKRCKIGPKSASSWTAKPNLGLTVKLFCCLPLPSITTLWLSLFPKRNSCRHSNFPKRKLVGRGGLEPPTSRLSGVRSNHLSYRPSVKWLRALHRVRPSVSATQMRGEAPGGAGEPLRSQTTTCARDCRQSLPHTPSSAAQMTWWSVSGSNR